MRRLVAAEFSPSRHDVVNDMEADDSVTIMAKSVEAQPMLYSSVDKLKEMLVQEARQAERLNVELQARDWERWQLLQLLHEKDSQLAHESVAEVKHRVAVASARQIARQWRATCVLRAWRECVRGNRDLRVVERTRRRCVQAQLSHACASLRAIMQNGLNRRLKDGLHALWLHSASTDKSLDLSRMPGRSSALLATSSPGRRDLDVAISEGLEALMAVTREDAAGDEEDGLRTPPSEARSAALSRSMTSPERHHRDDVGVHSSLGWRLRSPCMKTPRLPCGLGRTPSEASTSAPSLASQSLMTSGAGSLWTTSSAAPSGHHAVSQLTSAIEVVSLRRRYWAFSSLQRFSDWRLAEETRQTETCHLQAELNAQTSESARLSAEMQRRTQQHMRRVAAAADAAASEAREATLALVRSAESEASAASASNQDLQAKLQESEAIRNAAEDAKVKLEARLKHGTSWREEVETRIHGMVTCGEELEHERAHLKKQLAETRQRARKSGEQLQSLKISLEQEEQLGELLRARAWALDQDNAAIKRDAEQRIQAAEDSAAQECGQWQSELASVRRAGEEAQRRAVEATRAALVDKSNSEYKESVCALEAVRAELTAARHAELDEARVAKETQLAAQQAAERRVQASKTQLASEAAVCEDLVAQLRQRLSEVQEERTAQEERETLLREQVAKAVIAAPVVSTLACSTTSTAPSGTSTPRLRELDAYAELVDKLRAEVVREREEREAATRSLASLRGSYRLLLQRVGANGAERSPVSSPEKQVALGLRSGSECASVPSVRTLPSSWAAP